MAQPEKRLDAKYREMQSLVDSFAGYPCNADFDYSKLYRFLEMPMNNVGDPSASSSYRFNTHEFEREVIRLVAEYYGANEDTAWGYVTNGGSEGNLCGLHLARKIYPDAKVYYSTHSHYSIPKAIDITRSDGVQIPVKANGEIDYTELQKQLTANSSRPAIIMANLGTTMTGAIDDIHLIRQILSAEGIQDYYLHADGALHGLILPFTNSSKKVKLTDIHSIAISGHKFIGSPLPCGIFLTQKLLIEKLRNYIEYVDIHDSTITGSRNAITPLVLWYALYKKGQSHFAEMAKSCLDITTYAVEQLTAHGVAAWANPDSPIVVFPKPSPALTKKWQLAVYEEIAHIVVMPHIDKKCINRFVADVLLDQAGKLATPAEETGTLKNHWKPYAGIAAFVLAIASVAGGMALIE